MIAHTLLLRNVMAATALGLAAAAPLSGQVALTAETGASRTTVTDQQPLTSTAVTGTVSFYRPWTSAGASLSWSRFADSGGTALVGSVGASTFTGLLLRRLRAEFAVAGSLLSAGGTRGRLVPTARLHRLGEQGGAWIGAGYGVGRNADSTRGIAVAEGAAWLRRGPASLSIIAMPTRLSDGQRYLEGAITGRTERERVDLFVSLGYRGASETPAQTWASASITAWLTNQVALLASGGRYPDDPIQRLPGGRFIAIGLRLASRRPDRLIVATPAGAADLLPRRPTGPIVITVEATADPTIREIVVLAPGAVNVELQGDLTDWASLPLRREGRSRWLVQLPLQPGPYHVTVRIDGGDWIVPGGTTRVEDEFGGESGLLVVPQAMPR